MLERGTGVQRRAHVRTSWPADPRSLSRLRSELRNWLSPLGFAGEAADDIVLAASEAAANVIDHAYSAGHTVRTVEMDVWTADSTVHVQILDHGRWQPADSAPSYRGLGIYLMRQLLDDVVIEPGPTGTTVLFRHPLPGANPRGPAGHG